MLQNWIHLVCQGWPRICSVITRRLLSTSLVQSCRRVPCTPMSVAWRVSSRVVNVWCVKGRVSRWDTVLMKTTRMEQYKATSILPLNHRLHIAVSQTTSIQYFLCQQFDWAISWFVLSLVYHYQISFKTMDSWFAGVYGPVFVKLKGTDGRSYTTKSMK